MGLIARIILWGLLLLMLKDANSQSRPIACEQNVSPDHTKHVKQCLLFEQPVHQDRIRWNALVFVLVTGSEMREGLPAGLHANDDGSK
jgi:hypothetical protein